MSIVRVWFKVWKIWYDELKLLKGIHVCRSNTHPDMKSHVIERLATDHWHTSAFLGFDSA